MAISLEELKSVITEFIAEYRGNIPLKIIPFEHQEEAYGPEGSVENIGYAPGGYFPARARVAIVSSSLHNKDEAWKTVRHEVLGHYGLNTLRPEEKRELLCKVAQTRREKDLKEIWDYVDRYYAGLSPLRKAEEVFAYVAERPQTFAAACWTEVRAFFHYALRAAGLLTQPLTAQELQREANHIARGIRAGRQQQTFPQTDDAQFRICATADARARELSPDNSPIHDGGPSQASALPPFNSCTQPPDQEEDDGPRP